MHDTCKCYSRITSYNVCYTKLLRKLKDFCLLTLIFHTNNYISYRAFLLKYSSISYLGEILNKSNKLEILKALFYTCMILANVIAVKIGSFWGYFMTVGILTYPVTYLMTDIISECWSKEEART